MIWSSNSTTSGNATAKLWDNGNLVVVNTGKKVIWQSFDYPTDTLLPGMKIGRDYLRNMEWRLSSWKNSQDPAPGEWTLGTDTSGYPELKVKEGAVVKIRGEPMKNRWTTGEYQYNEEVTITYNVTINDSEASLSYSLENSSVLIRNTLNSAGHVEGLGWIEQGKRWQVFSSYSSSGCGAYNICNAYGACNMNKTQQSCTCLDEKMFVPKKQKDWDTGDWSGGCIRRTQLECKNGSEEFIKYSNIKLPDTVNSWFNLSMNLQECATTCLNNCTCMAYANPDSSKSICLLWFSDLLDIQMYEASGVGEDIFVRMASPKVGNNVSYLPSAPTYSQSTSKRKQGGANIKIILLVIFSGVLLTGLITSTWLFYAWRKRNHAESTVEGEILNASKSQEEMEQPLFSFSTIANATANFSPENKLGEGGFGPVYKGKLEEGQEIAVKRLSKSSSQGLAEFRNEVICISKLQHRNLVKILGCCTERDEKLLVYEYMPNKSLDSFIFDKTHSALLDWTKRFNIIKGIARGLVYLHQDSRLRIIHRDLKASNILLDQDMNPKISDFGLARSFGGNETQANTERVVGTYGYMSPEYALEDIFSIKSDVFSFGVLVLEIVRGKRNRGFVRSESQNNFIEHVWSLYHEGRSMELIDSRCVESCHPPEVIRSINIGLLCVQHNAGDRPHMSAVVMMLGSEGELPQPKQPLFFIEKQFQAATSLQVLTQGVPRTLRR